MLRSVRKATAVSDVVKTQIFHATTAERDRMLEPCTVHASLRINRLLSKQQWNRRVGACMGCTTAARWVAGKTKGEHLQCWQGDVADGRNVTIIDPGDDRTADDETDGKPNKSGRGSGLRSDRVDMRRSGRTCRRTSVTEYKFRQVKLV